MTWKQRNDVKAQEQAKPREYSSSNQRKPIVGQLLQKNSSNQRKPIVGQGIAEEQRGMPPRARKAAER
jgi:hypothetical protein